MKKILSTIMMLLMTVAVYAQKDVTTFLGIPVDGTKKHMKRELKKKGFTYNWYKDCLEGEFNGNKVNIQIVTNKDKVYRIVISDANYYSESDVKVKFNYLCGQFFWNEKYSISTSYTLDSLLIDDNEDISYEMMVKGKRYEACFYQYPKDSFTQMKEVANNIVAQNFNKLSEEEKEKMSFLLMDYYRTYKLVWFIIDENNGKYRIVLYYDNNYNKSDGEDL